MIVQKALQTRNMNDVCDNKYVKMAYSAENFNPQLQQALDLLGCNKANRQKGSTTTTITDSRYPTTIPPTSDDNDDDEEINNQDDNEETLESALPPEKRNTYSTIT